MDDTDPTLLGRVADGDQGAFERLYTRHAATLLRYAVQITGDRGRAEEALQDTFVAVWRGAGSFAGESAVRTWLFGICRRQSLKRLRGTGPATLPLDHASSMRSPAALPEEVALARADVASVGAALSRLPEGHREVLHLTFAAGLPQGEIAALLGIPVGTVKSRLFHARAALSRALPAEVDHLEAGR